MMEEEFYSTIKLSSGEELVAKNLLPSWPRILFLLRTPWLWNQWIKKKGKQNIEGFVLREWIHATYEDVFIIRMNQIITLSELDDNIKEFYLNIVEEKSKHPKARKEEKIDMGKYSDSKARQNIKDLSEKGYLGSVEYTKKILEEIFKKS